MAKNKVLAREVKEPNDIRFEEEVLVGWDKQGNKFMIIENYNDNRIHQVSRDMLVSEKDVGIVTGYSMEVNRWKEGMTFVEVARVLLKTGTRLWAFPTGDFAVSWFHDMEDNIASSVN